MSLIKIFKCVIYSIVLKLISERERERERKREKRKRERALIKLYVLPVGQLLSELSMLIYEAVGNALYITRSQLLELASVSI